MSFFTQTFFINLAMSFLTSTTFAIMFNTCKRHLFSVGICGLGTYAVFYTAQLFISSSFASAFLSAVFTAIFAEVIARTKKAPTIIFLLNGIVPTVPGGSLYYTMRYLILNDFDMAMKYLTETLEIGLGIAGGIVAVSIIFTNLSALREKRKSKKAIV